MLMLRDQSPQTNDWREMLYVIIFRADTSAGRAFDVALLWLIVLSVLAVIFESVDSLNADYGVWLRGLEWFFTLVFTLEYALRLVCVRNWWDYATSPLGVIDLLAVLPTYLSVFELGLQYFLVIRVLRLLRVFRILKLGRYVGEAELLIGALRAGRFKITVFLSTVLVMVVIIGTLMYVIEGVDSGFDSIPTGMYWAIVTLTTVGFGDITPVTVGGRFLAAVVMIMGYGVIAVPTGIVTAEIAYRAGRSKARLHCPDCGAGQHDSDAAYCKTCGGKLVRQVAGR